MPQGRPKSVQGGTPQRLWKTGHQKAANITKSRTNGQNVNQHLKIKIISDNIWWYLPVFIFDWFRRDAGIDFCVSFDSFLRFGMCLYRFVDFLKMFCFYCFCNDFRGCSPNTIPFLLLSVAHHFGVVFSMILSCFFVYFGCRFSNFGGQLVAKIKSKIDAENCVEDK